MKSRKNNLPQINWRRGALRPFESIYSFAAKFCKLNGISVRVFRLFIDEYTQENKWRESGFGSIGSKLLSKALGEPLSIVKTLSCSLYMIPFHLGEVHVSQRAVFDDDHLYYCPICASQAYHSIFHEFPWLDKCLIHDEKIERIKLGAKSANGKFESKVRSFYSVFSEYNQNWLESCADKKELSSEMIFDGVASYRKWGSKSINIINQMNKGYVRWFYGNERYFNNFKILLSRLNWLSKIPRRVANCLSDDLFSITPIMTNLSNGLVAEIAPNCTLRGLSDLVWFYLETLALNGESEPALDVARMEVAKFSEHALTCQCKWMKLHSLESWVPVSKKDWKSWTLQCPYEVARQYLNEKWLDFPFRGASPHRREMNALCYLESAEKLIRSGMVSPVDPIFHQLMFNPVFDKSPYVVWVDNGVITEFIKYLISKQIETDIAGLKKWIGLINDETPPSNMIQNIGEVEVYFGDEPKILVWPGCGS